MATRDLLIEIGTEELPPKTLSDLSQSFEDLLCGELKRLGLNYKSVRRFATPRRLAVVISSLQETQNDKEINKIGPAVSAAFDDNSAPTPAALGFAKSCGIPVEGLSRTIKDGIEKLSYSFSEKGGQTSDLLPAIVRKTLGQLPAPKRMRWGSSQEEFIRPVHWMVFLFGSEIIDLEIYGISSSRNTLGHRHHTDKEIAINNAADYEDCLETSGWVIPDLAKRKELVSKLIVEEGEKIGATTVVDEPLLDEVTALVEYPVALIGGFDIDFLDIPQEALILAMKSHQKCFYLIDGNKKLLPKFVTVSNIASRDPEQVIKGNERVIRPRLADARFFFETDRKSTLISKIEPLKNVVFQEKLGSIFDKSERVATLSAYIASELNIEPLHCKRAAMLSKCDLLTNMVAEFSDLQGVMGSYYAKHDKETHEVVCALREQYLPRFAGDDLPQSQTGTVLAIADRLDSIVGLFGVGQPPTGSKDPFGLRRSAIGILRMLLEGKYDLNIVRLIDTSIASYTVNEFNSNTASEVFKFLLERFKAWYQDAGVTTEVFQSVFVLQPTSPLDFHYRIQAVHKFNSMPEAKFLAAANKRVSNLLAKQEHELESRELNKSLFRESAELTLYEAIQAKKVEVAPLFMRRDYMAGLSSLSSLKTTIDGFFDTVLIIHDDPTVRTNRLILLQQLRKLFLQAADISYLHPD